MGSPLGSLDGKFEKGENRGKEEFHFMRKSGQVMKARETLKAFCETGS